MYNTRLMLFMPWTQTLNCSYLNHTYWTPWLPSANLS